MNLYGFVENNSISHLDRLGLNPVRVSEAMVEKGWAVSARLMRHWASLPANNNPKSHVNEDIVTMQWAVGFERAKKMHDELYSNGGYKNAAARVQLKIRLKDAGVWEEGGDFGDFSRKASEIEESSEYVNSRANNETLLDDLGGALGEFQMRIAVAGELIIEGGKRKFCYEKVGLYIVDTYDFNKRLDPLGFWNFNTNEVTLNPFIGIGGAWEFISNADFRKWRRVIGRGGDFEVYSDVEVHDVDDKIFLE